MKVVLVSLEPWDEVWRRNQHLARELVRQRLVSQLWFVEPPRRRRGISIRPIGPGLVAVTPDLPAPKTLGGLAAIGRRLRRHLLHDADLLWVNDPALGLHCLRRDLPTVYDVTDDWRTADFPARIVRRIVRAEDRLAVQARTVVCSATLQERWHQRYGVQAPVVHNGIDTEAWRRARPLPLQGPGPHLGYVGTLHEHRLDVDLVLRLAGTPGVGTVHLVGPNALPQEQTERLRAAAAVRLEGAVPPDQVPGWMLAMDVLVCPHRVTDFTRSLDAIKAYEYAAGGRPVVATPTSGFQAVPGRVQLVEATDFARVCAETARRSATPEAARRAANHEDVAWARRARQFFHHAVGASTVDLREPARA